MENKRLECLSKKSDKDQFCEYSSTVHWYDEVLQKSLTEIVESAADKQEKKTTKEQVEIFLNKYFNFEILYPFLSENKKIKFNLVSLGKGDFHYEKVVLSIVWILHFLNMNLFSKTKIFLCSKTE